MSGPSRATSTMIAASSEVATARGAATAPDTAKPTMAAGNISLPRDDLFLGFGLPTSFRNPSDTQLPWGWGRRSPLPPTSCSHRTHFETGETEHPLPEAEARQRARQDLNL